MSHPHDATARETILARIREALRMPAPPPHRPAAPKADAHGTGGLPTLTVLPAEAARPWLPDGGDTPAERLSILVENLGKLRAQVERVPDIAAAARWVRTLAADRGWRRVGVHGHPLVDPVATALSGETETCRVDAEAGGEATPIDKHTLETCDAGITACEVLVAQTGSILVSSASGGRALSILPHVHVVVASLDQIVATLGDALHHMRQRHAGHLPSMLSFITGPSRTGDIERILVLGAHGPKELVVVLVG